MVSFYNPQQEQEARRKRLFAERLAKQSEVTPNEVVSGIVVEKSPLENITKALGMGLSGYNEGRAGAIEGEVEKNRQGVMAEALSKWKDDPSAAAAMLAQDPRTSDMAAKILQGEVDYGRQKDRWAQEDALKQQYYNQRASSPDKIPAPMQISNRMFELEKTVNNPNATPEERFLAQREYNLLGQAAKTYAFGSGLTSNPQWEGYPNTQPPQAPVNQPYGPQPIVSEQPTSPQPTEVPQQNTPQIPTGPQIQPISGYADAAAEIAATKKGAEETAKKLNAAMPSAIVKEQNEIIDKVNVAQGLESSMGKFVNQIDTGSLDLGLMANLENKARNSLGMSTEESRNLNSFKSNLERLRNESLRLNTGVQTDGDAQRAWNELVSNINDPQVVRQRLTEIGEINRKGALLQNQKLNIMRNEYGRGKMNIPNIYNQPAPATQPSPKLKKNADGSYTYGE